MVPRVAQALSWSTMLDDSGCADRGTEPKRQWIHRLLLLLALTAGGWLMSALMHSQAQAAPAPVPLPHTPVAAQSPTTPAPGSGSTAGLGRTVTATTRPIHQLLHDAARVQRPDRAEPVTSTVRLVETEILPTARRVVPALPAPVRVLTGVVASTSSHTTSTLRTSLKKVLDTTRSTTRPVTALIIPTMRTVVHQASHTAPLSPVAGRPVAASAPAPSLTTATPLTLRALPRFVSATPAPRQTANMPLMAWNRPVVPLAAGSTSDRHATPPAVAATTPGDAPARPANPGPAPASPSPAAPAPASVTSAGATAPGQLNALLTDHRSQNQRGVWVRHLGRRFDAQPERAATPPVAPD